jgi:F0F1-type ATP synthase assembly protein I
MVAAASVTQLAIFSVGGLWLGYTLDGRFSTTPWLMFALTASGFGGGLFLLHRALSHTLDDDDDEPTPGDTP